MRTRIVVCAAAILSAVSPTFAGTTSYIGRAVGFAQNAPFTDDRSDQTMFSLYSESENERSGHGLAMTLFDFTGGTARARNHACAGSGDGPYPGDQADATSEVQLPNQTLFVRSPSLPDGATVAITLCFSLSSTMDGKVENNSTSNNFSRNSMSIRVNDQPVVSAAQQSTDGWTGFSNTGGFAGQGGSTATTAGTYTFNARVNRSFTLRLSLNSHSQVILSPKTSPSAPNKVAEGTGGCAMTFGLGSIAEDASLEYQGVNWTGNCGPSLPLIPENPVPAPGGVSALAVLGCAFAPRRKR